METNTDLYRRLQQHIDKMPVGFPESTSGAEIRLLKQLFTPEEAEIALELSALPEPLARIHKRLKGKYAADVLEIELDKMVEKGIILGGKLFKDKGPGKYYSKAMLAVGMYELQGKRLTRELEETFQSYASETFYTVFNTKKTSQMRTIPINKGIKTDRYVSTYDNAKELIKQVEGEFAVLECICRKGNDLVENSCKHSDIRETCLAFEATASYFIEAGARRITRDEALTIIDRAEEAGFVLQPENNQKPQFICCCCACCCNVLRGLRQFPKPVEYYHSNYYAKIDPALCGNCAECLDWCPMGALSNNNNGSVVDFDRCIGCGVCASKCPDGAIELKAKGNPYTPPKDHDGLYKKILLERYGKLGMLKMMPKMILGQKI